MIRTLKNHHACRLDVEPPAGPSLVGFCSAWSFHLEMSGTQQRAVSGGSTSLPGEPSATALGRHTDPP